MGACREKKESERIFDVAFRAMRTLDKLIWYGQHPPHEIQEELDCVTTALDGLMRAYSKEYKPPQGNP